MRRGMRMAAVADEQHPRHRERPDCEEDPSHGVRSSTWGLKRAWTQAYALSVRRALLVLALLTAAAPAQAAPGLTRYTIAGRCIAVGGTPEYFKATGLGTYMLAGPDGMLRAADGSKTATPGPSVEYAATVRGATVTLKPTAGGAAVTAPARIGHGCKPYPEAGVQATGKPGRGVRKDGTLIGFADAHLHITAQYRAGGSVIYGENFDRFGITEALGHDAGVHGPDGSLDVTGNLLRTGKPTGTHDTNGWPSFTGWPVFDTYTHQQVYYRWLQRLWMDGERLAVAQTVEDEPICNIEPTRSHSCSETDTIALEVKALQALQDYVDAQSGGPGKGWFRLVYDPAQARKAIAAGKLAVIIGVESSDPFGCSEKNGQAQCTQADVDNGIRAFHTEGVRALFITHWVDNAFAGAALEGGDKGTFINLLQQEETGNPFMTGPCPDPQQGTSCNSRGLTDLGKYLVGKLMDAHMLIEADHLGEGARETVTALTEARHYPLVSSHNGTGGFWTKAQLQRLHRDGGYVSATEEDAAPFAAKIANYGADGFTGVGIGTDTGGFNALPGPQKLPAGFYPFRALYGNVRLGREKSGTKTFALDKDGVAHYGLMADLLADVTRQKQGARARNLLMHSAEAYVETWERAVRAR
jgi:microsomal dipeptidase-like Zn-dependent dipeptidase